MTAKFPVFFLLPASWMSCGFDFDNRNVKQAHIFFMPIGLILEKPEKERVIFRGG